MRVDEREQSSLEGETIFCSEQGLKYKIVTYHGDDTHTLLNQRIRGEHYTVVWEDGREQRLSIVQMYSDTFEDE